MQVCWLMIDSVRRVSLSLKLSSLILMKARLKDVAERAGVAVNTASMILNHRPNSWASKATEARVHKAAADLNYQPSRAAVALRLGKFNTIGLVLPDLQNPYFSRMAESLQTEVAKKGYDLVIESSCLDIINEKKCLENIFDRQVDGLLCFLLENEKHRPLLIEQFARGKAIVAFEEATGPVLPVDSVAINFNPGVTEAIQHLVDAGHSQFAFLLALAEGQAEGDRPTTCRKLLQASGVKNGKVTIVKTGPTVAAAREATREMLRNEKNRPTALIAHNDLAAIGAMRAAKDLGLRVPEDLSVVGVDSTEIGAHLPVALTSVELPDNKMVREAVELLIRRLEEPKYAGPQRTEFSTRLVVRESTGPAPAR